MQYIVNAQEMKACDARTIEYYKVPSMVLMERAALACAEEILAGGYNLETVGIVCGMGNNGGDGLALARLLFQNNISVRVYLLGKEEKATGQMAAQLATARRYQIPILWIAGPDSTNSPSEVSVHASRIISLEEELEQELNRCTLLVDAIFGIGLSREICGSCAKVIEYMNQCPAPNVCIDIPSGIDAGNGRILGCAVKADLTITFAFNKAGLVLFPGADYAGRVIVKEIGITEESFDSQKPYLYTYSTQEILSMLPNRPRRSNKGTFGKAVLIAGSAGMAGAAFLTASAAYRMGCGLVRILSPEANREILQCLLPEAVLTTYDPEHIEAASEQLLQALKWGSVIGIGPGLGTSHAAEILLEMIFKETNTPLLIDGDGLNLLAQKQAAAEAVPPKISLLSQSDRPIVVTPHLGEMSRLSGLSISEIQPRLVETASDFARQHQVCCVLKDARTIVADAASEKHAYVNLTGNHGMATGGSGDILAGMICGLAAQGIPIGQASIMGVHLHGCAGDAAAIRNGTRSMLAGDIVDNISTILK